MLTAYLIVCLGGFLGANARYLIGGWVQRRWGVSFPYGTLTVNASGTFLFGLFATLAAHFLWNGFWGLLVTVGFIGSYTTFSTLEYETLLMITEGRQFRRAALNLLVSAAAGFLAAYLGIGTAQLLLRLHG